MAGRKQFDVDAALDTAMMLFWQRGYADTSLEQLNAATGLGRGSFYGAFGSKDELFRRALRQYAATYGARYEQALTAHPEDPALAIEAFFEVTLDRIEDPAVPGGCLIAQSAMQSAVLSVDSAAQVRRLLDSQRARIRTALDDPHADPVTLNELATYVVAVNQSLAVLSRANTAPEQLRAVARISCATVADRLARHH